MPHQSPATLLYSMSTNPRVAYYPTRINVQISHPRYFGWREALQLSLIMTLSGVASFYTDTAWWLMASAARLTRPITAEGCRMAAGYSGWRWQRTTCCVTLCTSESSSPTYRATSMTWHCLPKKNDQSHPKYTMWITDSFQSIQRDPYHRKQHVSSCLA